MDQDLIEFIQEDISFEFNNEPAVKSWLFHFITHFKKELGNLTFVFCSDEYLLEMNVKHLEHNYLTDIITFNYNEGNTVSGDIFISIDRVKDNASDLDVSFEDEICRVVAHGVLHLIGFNDKTPEEQTIMSSQEDFCLSLRDFKI